MTALGSWVRRCGAAVASVGLFAATACLPIPEAIIAVACGEVVDPDDVEAIGSFAPTPEGVDEEAFTRMLQTAQEARTLSTTALWDLVAWVAPTDSLTVEVGAVGDIAGLATILEQWVTFPDLLEIVDATVAVDLARDIIAEIRADSDLRRVGVGADGLISPHVEVKDSSTIEVALSPSARATSYAADLLATHRETIVIRSGGKVLTSDAEGVVSSCLVRIPKWTVANTPPDGVTVRIKLDRSTVARGESVTGAIIVTNQRSSVLAVWGLGNEFCGAPLSLPVATTDRQYAVNASAQGMDHRLWVQPDPSRGRYLGPRVSGGAVDHAIDDLGAGGCIDAPAFSAEIPPGGTTAIPFRADTLSMQPGPDLALPAGDYVVRPLAYLGAFNLVALPPAPFSIA